MEIRSFSLGEALKTGWRKFKEQPLTWIGAMLIMFLVWISHSIINSWMTGRAYFWDMDGMIKDQLSNDSLYFSEILAMIFISLVLFGLVLGLMSMALRAVDGQSVNITQIFSQFKYIFHYLIAHILYGLMIVAGFPLLVFPAAIWGSKFALYPFFIIDRGSGPIQALKLSSQATMGHKWDVFAFILISYIIYMISFFIGLIVIIPIVVIAWASIYRKLTAVFEPAVIQPNPPPVQQ